MDITRSHLKNLGKNVFHRHRGEQYHTGRNETKQRNKREEENGGGLTQAKRRRYEGSGWRVATP